MDQNNTLQPKQPTEATSPTSPTNQPPPNTGASPIPVPTAPQPKKSFLKNPLFWIVTIMLFAFTGAYYFIYSNLENKVSTYTNTRFHPSPVKTSSPTLIPPQADLPEEVVTFPIYPKAVYEKFEEASPCPTMHSGYSYCDQSTYTWKTSDDGDTVNNWYKNIASTSGWICGKEAAGDYAGPRDSLSWSSCEYSGKEYTFVIDAREIETTITLGIHNSK